MKHFLKSSLLIIFSLLCGICHFSEPTFAASFSLTTSSKQVSPGATFTVSVGGSCIGRVNIKVSGGTIPKDKAAVWVEENYQTITVTAGSSGTVTVTATPEVGFSDPDGNDYNPGSRSVSVAIVAPTPPATKPTTPTTPTPPASTNQAKPSAPSSSNNNSSNKAPENTPANSEKNEANEANQATEDNSDKSNNETSGSAPDSSIEDSANENENKAEEDQNEPDVYEKARTSAIIAWIIAGIFGILFLSTLVVLIYILRKNHPTTTSEKSARPSAKAKNQKSNAEHKSKEV